MATTAYNYRITIIHNADTSEGTLIRLGAFVKGDTGNGISSIVRTHTEGNVDTYTITYTDGSKTTFNVTNGGGSGDMRTYVYDPDHIIPDIQGGIPAYIAKKAAPRIDPNIGMTQEAINQLIIGSSLTSTLTPSSTLIHARVATTVTLVATANMVATGITIKKGNEVLATKENDNTLTCQDTITANHGDSIVYTATFVIGGVEYTKSCTVQAYNPIYYGLIESSWNSDVSGLASVWQANPKGSYGIPPIPDGQWKICFVIPSSMNIDRANVTFGGWLFPLDEPDSVTIEGEPYKCYRSSNVYDGPVTLDNPIKIA